MELYDVMRTTGSSRRFTDEPVPDEVLLRILDNARFAGSGGNRQPWRVIVLRDPGIRQRVAELYAATWDLYMVGRRRGEVPFHPGWEEPTPPVPHEPNDFAENLARTPPVLLLVCAHLGSLAVTDQALPRTSIVGGASVYPFVHNLLLAATNEGLGAVLTTVVARAEDELRTLLGIPKDHAVAALVAIGHALDRPTKLTRKPVQAFTTVDRFDGSPWP
ncbi:MAG TPA: nitroreductase family protein [Acidimicrobiales bacterium]